MQILFYPIFIDIFLLLVIVELILTIISRIKFNNIEKERSKNLEIAFPNYSKKDFKFRRESLTSYYKINSNHSFRLKVLNFCFLVLFFSIIGIVIFVFSANYSGMFFAMTALFISMGTITLSTPTYKSARAFWENYLIENPDNPLDYILHPDEKVPQYIKYTTINSYFRIFLGLYSLLVAYVLLQQNL